VELKDHNTYTDIDDSGGHMQAAHPCVSGGPRSFLKRRQSEVSGLVLHSDFTSGVMKAIE